MSRVLAFLAAATPTTDPANTYYSPGTIGFIMTFLLVVGAVLIIFDMVRRVRRVRYRAEIQERLDAEAAEKPVAEKPASAAKTASQPASKSAPKSAPQARKKPDRPAPPPRPKRD